MFKNLTAFVGAFVIAFCLTPFLATSCRTIDAHLAPAQVVTTVELRSQAITQADALLKAGKLPDAALIQLLRDDVSAWAYLRTSANGMTASADMQSVLQTQQIGLTVAIKKIAAGEYTVPEKVELLDTLVQTWASLETYYNPKVN
jgi:hypothetical protein